VLAGYHAELGRLTPVLASQLLLLGAGPPLAAALASWLLGGREPSAFTRQLLE
jgi:hypothetical protein